jgi:catechol 2,3-dioxygenase-like lactoylglutathione lyase family enzyme
VTVRIDHVAVPARNTEAEARFLGRILGLDGVAPAGPDGDMFSLPLGAGAGEVLFVDATDVPSLHLAFRVPTSADLHRVVERLRGLNVAFGNGPEAIDNGLTHDPLGSEGRVYFASPDGHLFEVTVHP